MDVRKQPTWLLVVVLVVLQTMSGS